MSSHLHLAWQEGPELSSSWQSQRGITSLMLACRLSNLAPNFQASKQVRELLAAKADPAAKAKSNLTALHMAAESLPPQIQHIPFHWETPTRLQTPTHQCPHARIPCHRQWATLTWFSSWWTSSTPTRSTTR